MDSYSLYDDHELFRRIASGDGNAFTQLFNRHFNSLLWNATNILKSEFWAEEIVQEVFMQVWSGRENLTDVGSPSAYLFKITANRCFDRIRRHHLEVKMQYLVNSALHGTEHSHQANTYDTQVIEKLIREAVNLLPEQGRLVFELQRTKGLTYQQIANQLDISKNTVRNHMVKNLQTIRSYLQTKGGLFLVIFSIWYFSIFF